MSHDIDNLSFYNVLPYINQYSKIICKFAVNVGKGIVNLL